MYSFSLKPTGRKVDPASAPPPPAHVIRAPIELQHRNAPHSDQDDTPLPPDHHHQLLSSDHPSNGGASDRNGAPAANPPSPQPHALSTASSLLHPPVLVHNVSAYADMRDAADWSAAVQRERAEKRQRALSLHEAAKAEEQHRREVAEAQSKRELQRRKEERQQMRKALKEDDEMTDFQDRSTQFLKNQQRLINLGASVAYAEQQHKARAKEDMHKTWTKSLTGASAGAAAMTMTMTMGNSTTGYPLSSVPVSSRAAGPPAARTAAALSKESELRQAALYTEDAYVQLSLAYRNEAHRSRATAGILAAPAANSAVASSTAGSAPAVTACGPGPASVAPLPFRTAPQMYCHDSADHMGSFAHDIPTTYIPEYFEDRYGATGAVSASGAANGFGEEVMPLPLTPAPVSQEASNALRHSYYPWAALADAGTDNAKPVLPSREAYFPVERWGAAELQASIYGHNVHPNGTMQESCERRREFAEDFNYTTIPCDNATATSNSPEKIEPYHSGKRIDVWL